MCCTSRSVVLFVKKASIRRACYVQVVIQSLVFSFISMDEFQKLVNRFLFNEIHLKMILPIILEQFRRLLSYWYEHPNEPVICLWFFIWPFLLINRSDYLEVGYIISNISNNNFNVFLSHFLDRIQNISQNLFNIHYSTTGLKQDF